MNATGEVTIMGGSLVVNTTDTNWTAIIRRSDDASDNSFYDYQGKPVTILDIKRYIPNYASLSWRRIEGIFNKDGWELLAKDTEYRINLHPKKQLGLTEQALIDSFSEALK